MTGARLRVLITRPEPAAAATADRISGLGHVPSTLALFSYAFLPQPKKWPRARCVAVTSQAAIRALIEFGAEGFLESVPVYAVGCRTAEAARRAGARCVLTGQGDGVSLAGRIIAEWDRLPGDGGVLYLTGRRRTPDFEAAFKQAGIAVEPVELYDSQPIAYGHAELTTRLSPSPDRVLLYSPEAARRFSRLASPQAWQTLLPACRFLCLSARTAHAMGELHDLFPVTTAREPTEAALLRLLQVEG